MLIGTAWQKTIRDKKRQSDLAVMFKSRSTKALHPRADISKAECREISYSDAKKIILEYEWLGTMGTTQMHYGIFFEGQVAGVICFGYFQAMQPSN